MDSSSQKYVTVRWVGASDAINRLIRFASLSNLTLEQLVGPVRCTWSWAWNRPLGLYDAWSCTWNRPRSWKTNKNGDGYVIIHPVNLLCLLSHRTPLFPLGGEKDSMLRNLGERRKKIRLVRWQTYSKCWSTDQILITTSQQVLIENRTTTLFFLVQPNKLY